MASENPLSTLAGHLGLQPRQKTIADTSPAPSTKGGSNMLKTPPMTFDGSHCHRDVFVPTLDSTERAADRCSIKPSGPTADKDTGPGWVDVQTLSQAFAYRSPQAIHLGSRGTAG